MINRIVAIAKKALKQKSAIEKNISSTLLGDDSEKIKIEMNKDDELIYTKVGIPFIELSDSIKRLGYYNEPKKKYSSGGLDKVETPFLKKTKRRHRVSPCANGTTRNSRRRSPSRQ
jgi:hypothetical protein